MFDIFPRDPRHHSPINGKEANKMEKKPIKRKQKSIKRKRNITVPSSRGKTMFTCECILTSKLWLVKSRNIISRHSFHCLQERIKLRIDLLKPFFPNILKLKKYKSLM